MKNFRLPDLGEGLTEAEIVSWRVKPGDRIARGDIMLSVETAKAVVEIPSPVTAEITAVHGKAGELVQVGALLVEFAGAAESGTVVGHLPAGKSEAVLSEDNFVVGAVAATVEDERGEPLKGVRRAMAKNLAAAHSQVAQVTILEDADIQLWPAKTDITVRLVRAIAAGVKVEPVMNSWYHMRSLRLQTIPEIDLGIAVDTPDGLFVPILRGVQNRTAADLRRGLDQLRADVLARTIPAGEMKNPTITLSNFGTIAGKYGDPIIVPPTVCIVGAGKIREMVVPDNGKPAIHRMLPLSVSFDHRVITGGEAARFVAALVADLGRRD